MKGGSAEEALERLSADLGIEKTHLRYLKVSNDEYSFEALVCPPILDIEVSKDKLKAKIRRIQMPVGAEAPKLTTDYVLQKLKEKGITSGIKTEEITSELFKIFSDPHFRDSKPLNILVAEGEKASAAQGGRPQWSLDLKLFEKSKFIQAKKGDVVAIAPIAVQGREGITVTGEKIPFEYEDSFRLPVGKGIASRRTENGTEYYAESFGRLYLDDGTRMRLEVEVEDQNEGLAAAITLGGPKSFSGKTIEADELISAAQSAGVSRGFLPAQEIQRQIERNKKWPAKIVVARGEEPTNGKAGNLKFPYKEPESDRALDVERAKAAVVFPEEVLAIIEPPAPPKDGFTVFGEILRGRPYGEQPIYPGRNIKRVRKETHDELIANIYGKVSIEEDRIHVENLLRVSPDAMEASLDVFPQKLLSFENILALLRDKDVLVGFDKDEIARKLDLIHRSQIREKKLIVAQAQAPQAGKSAKIRYYFKPSEMKEKGIIMKTAAKEYYAAPNDLLMIKFLPEEAKEGFNLYREKIPVPKSMEPADTEIEIGSMVKEDLKGREDDPNDPLRLEYRAETFGIVEWKNKRLDLRPVVQIPEKEDYVSIRIPQRSHFGSPITFEMIKSFAEEEGVRVELEREAIDKALRQSRAEPTELVEVVIAKEIPAKNGEDAKVDYLIKINGENVQKYLNGEIPMPDKIEQADCVRPHEVIAVKTPAGNGEDGRTVFGRRIVAERGVDEPWLIGRGLEKGADDRSLLVTTPHPSFVLIEDGRLVAENTVEIASDKMKASMTIYPSENPRFQPREERIMMMIQQKGIQAGIQVEKIREAIQTCLVEKLPQTFDVALGTPPSEGEEASHRLTVDEERSAVRSDGSVDYREARVFQQVRGGQLLMVKRPATRGADGFNVLDERIPGIMGKDHQVDPGEGVKVSDNGLEFTASRDGILEFTGKRIQVIEGLLVPGDVDFSTGNIDADQAKVMIRGSVMPGFSVTSKSDVKVEKIAEACTIRSGGELNLNGGLIGKGKAHVSARKRIEALYINSESIVDCDGDVIARNEILNSRVHAGGAVKCLEGAGTIAGGEIWAQNGIEAKSLGAQGSESATHIHLGLNYLELQSALGRIADEGLNDKEAEFKQELRKLDEELREIYDLIPEATKRSTSEASELQGRYKELFDIRKEYQEQLDLVEKQKNVILNHVQKSKDFRVLVQDMIHPGVIFHHDGVDWVIKEPLRGVEITWSEASKNFTTRRAG